MKEHSFSSMNNSLNVSFESQNLSSKSVETEDEATDSLNKYARIGFLTDSVSIKESECTKHYDEQGNKYYNEYKFISILGSGAYSKIELVEKDGVKYALKIIDKSFLKSKKNFVFDAEGNVIVNDNFESALKEIAILKKTNHPNIVKLYEILYCKKNKKIYLILEYCEHGELILYDDETGQFKVNENIQLKRKKGENGESYYKTKEILKFIKDIIAGLCYLHSNGIIHRDIKPNNILLDKNNECKITDFNVSSILEDLNDDNIGRKICTADHFRPPEGCQLTKDDNGEEEKKENQVDLRGKPIDIWALGVTAYILAYNKFPFESEKGSIIELYNKINKAEFEFPEFPKRKGRLKFLIRRCLEKDPNKRITAEGLSHLPFLNKYCPENIGKWKGFKKINVCEKDMINSLNFFVPNCTAVFKKVGNNIGKKVDTKLFRYKKFKGKIFQLPKFNPLQKKYGGFKIDVNLFNKKLFGNPLTKKIHNHTRQMKKKLFSHFKKYQEEDKKEEEQK